MTIPSSDQIASASRSLLVADLGRERQAPGGVDPAAERREHAEAPVADLVAEALDHDRLVGGNHAGRRLLLGQVADEVLRRRSLSRSFSLASFFGSALTASRAKAPIALPSSAGRPIPSPRQNGTAPGVPGAGRDDHPVTGDLLDPPGARPEQEGLAGSGLVDHLLVELADPPSVGQVNAVEAAIRDRAGVGHGQLAGARTAAHRALGAVPDDPRAQLGEALGGIAPVEHVEDVLELLAGDLGEGLRGADQLLDLVDLPLVERGHRDQMLGQHVEGVLRDHRLLDLARRASGGRPRRTRAGRP